MSSVMEALKSWEEMGYHRFVIGGEEIHNLRKPKDLLECLVKAAGVALGNHLLTVDDLDFASEDARCIWLASSLDEWEGYVRLKVGR